MAGDEDGGAGFRALLEARKRDSVGQLLFKCARLFNDQALARVRARSGAPALRPSHTALFPHIGLQGTRLTDIAERLGVSKQAVGQVVAELEGMGVVERVPDAEDGRAKRVRFSARGRRGLMQGLGVLGSLEDELATVLGQRSMAQLQRLLQALLAALEARAPQPPPDRS